MTLASHVGAYLSPIALLPIYPPVNGLEKQQKVAKAFRPPATHMGDLVEAPGHVEA